MSTEKSSLPWYKEGLKFECTGCGRCCTGPSGYVWVSDPEMQEMADTLNIDLSLFKRKYTRQVNGAYALTERKNMREEFDCVFLKDNKCAIYKARPQQCRTFPWWQENLNSQESWALAAKECEGINDKAPLISADQINQIGNI